MTLAEMKLVPAPRRVTAGQDVLRIKRAFSTRTVDALPWRGAEFPARLESALASAGLKVKFFEVDQYEEQSYKIEIGRGGVIVCARNVRGLAYGAETLRQILTQCGNELPCGVVEDAPRYGWRAVMLDLRVHKYKPAYLKALCAELGRLKYSALVLNYHDTFAYKKEPCLRGDVYISAEQIAELNKAASEAGIELIPFVSVVGVLEHIVELERYRGLRANDGTLDVRNPRSSKLICALLDEVMAAHDASVIGLGVAAPLGAPLALDDAALAYLDTLVAHVIKRNKSPLLCIGADGRVAAWLEHAPKNAIIAHPAADADGVRQLAGACARHDLRMAGMTSARGPRDSEWCSDVAAAAQRLQSEAVIMAEAGITRALVVVPSGCGCSMPQRPAPSALCGTRMMHVDMAMPALAVAADALWSEQPSTERIMAAWPLYWWGVDDARYNELIAACQTSPFDTAHSAELVKRCKRVSKLAAELKPLRHAAQLAVYDLYARLALHGVHVRQTFSHAPRAQQVTLLQNELERLKDLLKDVLSATLYRHEVQEEQAHYFGHTEMLLARLK